MRKTYEDHRARSESDYAETFSRWFQELTPGQLAILHRNGIEGAEIDGRASGTAVEQDAAEISASRVLVDVPRQVDTLSDEFQEKFELGQEVSLPLAAWAIYEIERRAMQYKSRLLSKLVGGLIDAENPKLMVAGLAFAASLDALNGLGTQREYARKIHVTPAALSKVVKLWQIALEMNTSAHQKSAASCVTYARVQSSDQHWRRQKAGMQSTLELSALHQLS